MPVMISCTRMRFVSANLMSCISAVFDQRIGIDVRPDDVLISLADRQGSVTSTRAMNFMLENKPGYVHAVDGGDNLSNLLSRT
ncbi:Uncharacterised protein [Citrobacter freundii]|nr:Uncharacterised protein [Citrobacter freundii]